MPAGQVWGLVMEEHLIRCNWELREGAALEERLGLIKEMEVIRKEIAQRNLEEDEELMHESPEHWWYHKQVKEGMYCLHERLVVLVQEEDQGITAGINGCGTLYPRLRLHHAQLHTS